MADTQANGMQGNEHPDGTGRDGLAAVAMVLLAGALIAFLIFQIV